MKKNCSIDLHGYSVPEAIALFTERYNSFVHSGQQGFVEVIHGYGSSGRGGAIAAALQQLLRSSSAYVEYWIPGDTIGNPGITKVYPKKLLPTSHADADSPVRQAVLRYCDTPKPRAKVIAKLCGRFGGRALQNELDRMMREGLLRDIDGKVHRS